MTGPTSSPRDPRLSRSILIILAMSLGLVGYYGPWVAHKAAGLVIMGLDLAEYVKFLPQVASGQFAIRREVFYLPLMTASISASLFASRRFLPTWMRWTLALLAIPLALAMLPPAWSPAILGLAEYRTQVLLIAICLLLIPGVAFLSHLPDRVVLLIVGTLALIAALGPMWAFIQVRPAIAEAYRQPPRLGRHRPKP